MHRRSIRWLWLTMISASLVLATGCGNGNTDPPVVDAPPAVTCADEDTAIRDVQDDTMAEDTPVALCEVVVTAIDNYGDFQNAMYVQEPDGGEYSGILVYFGDAGVPADIQVGDLVSISGGVKAEFAPASDTSGETMTELVARDGGAIEVTRVGDGQVPDPVVLDPWVIIGSPTEAEKWEGVLVQFDNVYLQRGPLSVGSDNAHVYVTGPIEVQGSMTDAVERLTLDTCYGSMVGVLDYFRNLQLLPRSVDDIIDGGTGCLPLEEGGCSVR